MRVELEIPLQTPNRAEHHFSRSWRRKTERAEVARGLVKLMGVRPPGPWLVTITRLAAKELDGHDNLRGACKSVVDEVAAWLGLASDRDPSVTWCYRQEVRREPARLLRTPTGREKKPKTALRSWCAVEIVTRSERDTRFAESLAWTLDEHAETFKKLAATEKAEREGSKPERPAVGARVVGDFGRSIFSK